MAVFNLYLTRKISRANGVRNRPTTKVTVNQQYYWKLHIVDLLSVNITLR